MTKLCVISGYISLTQQILLFIVSALLICKLVSSKGSKCIVKDWVLVPIQFYNVQIVNMKRKC